MADKPKPELNSKQLFAVMTDRLKGKPTEIHQKINAHIRAVSGHATIVAFENNGSSEEQKIEVYRDCITALVRGDYSDLKGGPAKGQVLVESDTPAMKFVVDGKQVVGVQPAGGQKEPKAPTLTQEAPKPKLATVTPPGVPIVAPAPATVASPAAPVADPTVLAIAQAIAASLPKQAPAPTVSEERIRQIVTEEIAKTVAGFQKAFEERGSKRLELLVTAGKLQLLEVMDRRYASNCEELADALDQIAKDHGKKY